MIRSFTFIIELNTRKENESLGIHAKNNYEFKHFCDIILSLFFYIAVLDKEKFNKTDSSGEKKAMAFSILEYCFRSPFRFYRNVKVYKSNFTSEYRIFYTFTDLFAKSESRFYAGYIDYAKRSFLPITYGCIHQSLHSRVG